MKKVVSRRKLFLFLLPLIIFYLNTIYVDKKHLLYSDEIWTIIQNKNPPAVNYDAIQNNEENIKYTPLFREEDSVDSLTHGKSTIHGDSGKNYLTTTGENPSMLEQDKKEVVEIENDHKTKGMDVNVGKTTIESTQDNPIIPDDSQYPFTFSGCLMVKDDNQILPEWLAYHYTFLPLRHLIIAVDPMSYTRVEGLVEKFRSIGMKIMLMTGNEYFVDGNWYNNQLKNFDPRNHTKEHRYQFLMHRQSSFYSRCFRILHKNGFNHTMILDSDEFFTFNQEWDKTYSYNESSSSGIPDIPSHVGKQNETLAHWIDSGADPILSKLSSEEHRGCIVIPRVLVSSIESTFEETAGHVEDGFNASYFNTILYQKRGALEWEEMQIGKSFLNLRHYRWNNCENPHVAFPACFIVDAGGGAQSKQPKAYSIHVHHNIGSYESFVNLNPFRKRYSFDERSSSISDFVTDSSKAGWLKEFIQLVGKEKSLELTQSSRIAAFMEDTIMTERLRHNETVDFAYEWDESKSEPHDDNEWRAFTFD